MGHHGVATELCDWWISMSSQACGRTRPTTAGPPKSAIGAGAGHCPRHSDPRRSDLTGGQPRNHEAIGRALRCLLPLPGQLRAGHPPRANGRCLLTGNGGGDGWNHCAMDNLHGLQPFGCTIPYQADAGRVGEAGPLLSYLDPSSGAPAMGTRHLTAAFVLPVDR